MSDGMRIVETGPCPVCLKSSTVQVPSFKYNLWLRKEGLIQDLMPELSVDDRELLITGTHSECWDRMFGEEP